MFWNARNLVSLDAWYYFSHIFFGRVFQPWVAFLGKDCGVKLFPGFNLIKLKQCMPIGFSFFRIFDR